MSVLKLETRDVRNTSPHKLRCSGVIPGVVYATGMESQSVQVSEKDLRKVIAAGEHVFEIQIGSAGTELVSLSEVQRDPVSHKFIHVSLHQLKRGQATSVMLPVHFVGEAVGTRTGGVVMHNLEEVEVYGKPGDMPNHIEVDISSLDVGAHLCVKDITVPAGLELRGDQDRTVATCHHPKVEKEEPVAEVIVEGAEAPAAEATATDEEAKEAA